jgi:hippurate hydrolase
MVAENVLDGVEMIFGGHVDRHYASGTVVVTEGAVNASTDTFTIDIHGKGGHGARPHEALDAVVVGSLLVTAIQTIVSREINPAHPSVVTVGTFQSGTAPNVIAARAKLSGTIRAQKREVREHLTAALARIAQAIGQLHGASVEVTIERGTPPLVNTKEMASVAHDAARDVVGFERIVPLESANMGGEDFAVFLERVRGCYVRFGARLEGRESFPAHSSQFDFDERALAVGAAWFDRVARRAGDLLSVEHEPRAGARGADRP